MLPASRDGRVRAKNCPREKRLQLRGTERWGSERVHCGRGFGETTDLLGCNGCISTPFDERLKRARISLMYGLSPLEDRILPYRFWGRPNG